MNPIDEKSVHRHESHERPKPSAAENAVNFLKLLAAAAILGLAVWFIDKGVS